MYMLLFLIDSFTCIYKYISGLSFWTFFIFLYFGCFLLNIAWPSLNLWPQDPWSSALAQLRHYWPVVFPWVLISTFGLQLSTFLAIFLFLMVGKGGFISLKGLLPATVRQFGGCSACAAPAAAAASCARLVLPWPAAPTPLLLEALHHRRLSY